MLYALIPKDCLFKKYCNVGWVLNPALVYITNSAHLCGAKNKSCKLTILQKNTHPTVD